MPNSAAARLLLSSRPPSSTRIDGRARHVVAVALGASALTFAQPGSAQSTGFRDGLAVGAWVFEPSIDVRIRAEYRRVPVDTGGLVYASTAILADADGSATPTIAATLPGVRDQAFVAGRTRLGLRVARGPVTAQVTLEDARVWGIEDLPPSGPRAPALPRLAPLDAFIELGQARRRPTFFRVGRQRVTWGDGRLLSENDWGQVGRALDGARFYTQAGDIDIDLLAAMLAPPGGLPPAVTGARGSTSAGPGSQLYGARAAWRLAPLFNIEPTALLRAVREPVPASLTPGDTALGSLRLFGAKRGFVYSAEGAYELGRVASVGDARPLSAFALAARAQLETKLPWHMTFGAHASYASGDSDPSSSGTVTRFDPILPDERQNHGPLGLVAWSNSVDAGGEIALRPGDRTTVTLGYRWLGLAQPTDRWTTAALVPVGAAPANGSTSIGHELDVVLTTAPWDAFRLETGYGICAFGAGAEAVLESAQRSTGSVQHWGYVAARVIAP